MWEYINSIHPVSENISGVLTFGGNILFDLLAALFGKTYLPMYEMYHFPFIVAGWFGLLITALNLMPIGQLDGGHITHAMFGSKSSRIAVLGFLALIFLNIILISQFNSYVYVLWPILILVFIKFKHPPTLDDSIPIGSGRKFLGYLAYIIFILCFSPMPVYFQ
jgi:membrane-associated protease RseP (regulator of RpoE activity)